MYIYIYIYTKIILYFPTTMSLKGLHTNHMFGAKYITKSQVRHSKVIITDFNTQGKYTDAS